MNTGTVSVRYAKALLAYAVEQGDDKQVYAEMQTLAGRLRQVHAIHDRINDPTVSVSAKCSLLETAVTDGKSRISGSTSAFFKLVVGAGRGDCLLFMSVSYMDQYRRRNGIVPVELVTATQVGDERRERLKQLVENVEHGKVIARSSLQAAEFAIRSGEAQLKEARENLLKTTLYAPMDGIISRMSVEKGERVVGTSQMPGTELFRIADFSRMEVVVEVGESDIVRIELRDSVDVEIDAYPRRKFRGLVTQIANSAKVANFEVRIELLPDSLKFLPGMSAAVRIITDRRDGCLTLPVESLFIRDKEPCVWLADTDDKARAASVVTGIQDLDRIEIREGLTVDDRVVVGPPEAIGQKLQEGQKLKISAKSLRYE